MKKFKTLTVGSYCACLLLIFALEQWNESGNNTCSDSLSLRPPLLCLFYLSAFCFNSLHLFFSHCSPSLPLFPVAFNPLQFD